MKNSFKKMCSMSLTTSLILMVVGFLILIFPQVILSLISYILGGIVLVNGALTILRYFKENNANIWNFDLAYGLLCSVLALVIIFNPNAIVSIIPLILGIWMMISSIFKIQYSLNLRTYHSDKWTLTLGLAILTLICGVLLTVNPFKGAVTMTKVIGIFIIVYSIIDIIECMTLKKSLNKIVDIIDI